MFKLEASTSPGRAGAVGMLQAILQVMLQGAGPLLIGRSACGAFCSWVLVPFLTLGLLALLAPRYCRFVGVTGS